MINVAINAVELNFFQALFGTTRLLSLAKRMSVSYSFCPQGLHSSFLISGVHSLCVPLFLSGAMAFFLPCSTAVKQG